MLKKILAKISFFSALLFGLCIFSGCGSQTTITPASQSNNTVSIHQQKQAQVQVNTRTRAS